MRFVRTAALLAALWLPHATPFTPLKPNTISKTRLLAQEEEAPCETSNAEFKDLMSEPGSAQLLRQATLTNAKGELKNLGDAMGPNTSVEWCELQPQLDEAGIVGPLFISIGDKEKLSKFLELNPYVPQDQMFVDDYNFEAYNAVGLKKFTDISKDVVKDVKMTAPELEGGIKGWWNYMTNVATLAPVDKNKPGIPEGVLRLGATFVVSKNNVVYQWNDRVPGDHPNLDEVLTVAKEAAEKSSKGAFGLSWS